MYCWSVVIVDVVPPYQSIGCVPYPNSSWTGTTTRLANHAWTLATGRLSGVQQRSHCPSFAFVRLFLVYHLWLWNSETSFIERGIQGSSTMVDDFKSQRGHSNQGELFRCYKHFVWLSCIIFSIFYLIVYVYFDNIAIRKMRRNLSETNDRVKTQFVYRRLCWTAATAVVSHLTVRMCVRRHPWQLH